MCTIFPHSLISVLLSSSFSANFSSFWVNFLLSLVLKKAFVTSLNMLSLLCAIRKLLIFISFTFISDCNFAYFRIWSEKKPRVKQGNEKICIARRSHFHSFIPSTTMHMQKKASKSKKLNYCERTAFFACRTCRCKY